MWNYEKCTGFPGFVSDCEILCQPIDWSIAIFNTRGGGDSR